MTFLLAKSKIAALGLVLTKTTVAGEFKVSDPRDPESGYFTDDLQDAYDTAKDIVSRRRSTVHHKATGISFEDLFVLAVFNGEFSSTLVDTVYHSEGDAKSNIGDAIRRHSEESDDVYQVSDVKAMKLSDFINSFYE